MTQETINIILIVSPLIVGGIIAAVNSNGINDATEKVEAWVRKRQQIASNSNGWFSKYILNPVLWLVVKFSDWTDSFTHRGLKNGARALASLYLIGAWLFILYLAIMVVLIIIIAGVLLYVLFKILGASIQDENFNKGVRIGKGVFGPTAKGTRVNPDSGRIQKEGLLGWVDTNERIDPQTGKYQEEGLLGWKDTDTRINQETGIVQQEGLLGYRDTETRVNPETGIIQKQGLLGWQDTERRVNPETGRAQKQGLLGWVDE
jgi:hypothetical protein